MCMLKSSVELRDKMHANDNNHYFKAGLKIKLQLKHDALAKIVRY